MKKINKHKTSIFNGVTNALKEAGLDKEYNIEHLELAGKRLDDGCREVIVCRRERNPKTGRYRTVCRKEVRCD